MARLFIYLLIALGLGTYLSILFRDDPGYVLITIGSYSLESTLATMLISLLVFYVLLYGLFKFLHLANPLKLFKKDTWYRLFFRKNARLLSEKGLQLLLLGHWQEAYKNLVESADRVQLPAFNYLAAAYAAFQRHDQLACNFCLSQAKQNSLVGIAGIKTFQALLEHQAGREEQSLALLLAIQQEQPGNPYVLVLLKDIYLGLKDREKLAVLVTDLENARVLGNEELVQLKEQLAIHRLHKLTAKQASLSELNTLWHELSKTLQRREYVMEAYARALLSINEMAEAEQQLLKFIKRQRSDRLILLMGYIDPDDAASLLLLLEGWIKDRPNNVVLMLSLGRLSLRNKLWGKGREYFEKGLRASENPELSAEFNAELARLLEHLGEHEKSLICYRHAMGLMASKLPQLPMPSTLNSTVSA
ncbi:MAG: heme biosynthesis HemY N-terminal domain-containing protein [Pseudohongiellaceae bacterium]